MSDDDGGVNELVEHFEGFFELLDLMADGPTPGNDPNCTHDRMAVNPYSVTGTLAVGICLGCGSRRLVTIGSGSYSREEPNGNTYSRGST